MLSIAWRDIYLAVFDGLYCTPQLLLQRLISDIAQNDSIQDFVQPPWCCRHRIIILLTQSQEWVGRTLHVAIEPILLFFFHHLLYSRHPLFPFPCLHTSILLQILTRPLASQIHWIDPFPFEGLGLIINQEFQGRCIESAPPKMYCLVGTFRFFSSYWAVLYWKICQLRLWRWLLNIEEKEKEKKEAGIYPPKYPAIVLRRYSLCLCWLTTLFSPWKFTRSNSGSHCNPLTLAKATKFVLLPM